MAAGIHPDMFLRIFALVLLAAGPAHAEGTIAAAGRIEHSVRKWSCSASLIAPDLIVTAAHCVGGPADAGVVFRPGDGEAGETYPLVRVARHPLYDPEMERHEWRLRFDMAVARLARPVPVRRALPFSPGPEARPGETLFIVSWRSGQALRPRQRSCPVLQGRTGLVTLGCPVKGGESGAPVLRRTDAGLELVAVISSRSRIADQPVAQASDVALRLPPLLDLIKAE